MPSIKVPVHEIQVGKAIPWTVYDQHGKMLLKRGTVIGSQNQRDLLVQRGLYRADGKQNAYLQEKKKERIEDNASPFDLFNDIAFRVKHLFEGIMRQDTETSKRVVRLAADIQALVEFDADAALGAVHVVHGHPYTIYHPLHVAVICETIARALDYPEEDRIPILAAAITSNIAMNELQELLQQQTAPLSEEQRKQINTHPERSQRLLKVAGVTDEIWLKAVLEHHEMMDGSGYPQGLKEEQICDAARIVALADKYSALLSPRAYRESLTAQAALKQFFVDKGKQYDEALSMLFIKELGIFPPGAFVKLVNGETAIVTKRGKENSLYPTVCSYIGADGRPYGTPMKRETKVDGHGIKEICKPDKQIPLNLRILWGYH